MRSFVLNTCERSRKAKTVKELLDVTTWRPLVMLTKATSVVWGDRVQIREDKGYTLTWEGRWRKQSNKIVVHWRRDMMGIWGWRGEITAWLSDDGNDAVEKEKLLVQENESDYRREISIAKWRRGSVYRLGCCPWTEAGTLLPRWQRETESVGVDTGGWEVVGRQMSSTLITYLFQWIMGQVMEDK